MTSLLISINSEGDSYDLILVIVDRLIKMVNYKPVKIIIDIPSLAKVIINIVIYHYKVLELIVMDQSLFIMSKFWFLLCYFLEIKKTIHNFLYTNKWPNTKTK